MPYLSRIRINHLRPASRQLLANPHVAHGAVVGGLVELTDTERPLWRWDTDRAQRSHLTVCTESKPDWTHITEQYGWPDADGDQVVVRDYTPLLARLEAGQEYAFRITANPVQNLVPQREKDGASEAGTSRSKTRSRRTGHRTAAHQWKWFLTRAQGWGFEIPQAPVPATTRPSDDPAATADLRITHRERLAFEKKGRSVVLTIASFHGRLRITDRDRFAHHLTAGFGPAKAYGCGLLTLAPLEAVQGS